MTILGLLILMLVLAVLIWGGDALLKLLPGNEKIKQVVRILAIVVLALWFLSLAADLLGVPMPWSVGPLYRHR